MSIEPDVLDVQSIYSQGQTVLFVAIDRKLAGILAVADRLKPHVFEAVRALHREGIRLVMVTGDERKTAEFVAGEIGIDEVFAELLPQQKAEIVKTLQENGRLVAMAGDGVNDAPGLAQAHVGIAMGTGADVAIQSAGVTLVKGDLRGIVRARKLSIVTMRNVKQNLFGALFYNMLGIPIAAGALYPIWGILLNPMFGAAAMSFSLISVVSNAFRIQGAKV